MRGHERTTRTVEHMAVLRIDGEADSLMRSDINGSAGLRDDSSALIEIGVNQRD